MSIKRRTVISGLLVSALPQIAQAASRLRRGGGGSASGPAISVPLTPQAEGDVGIVVERGPGNILDWVTLNYVGAPFGAYLDWCYLSGTKDPPAIGLTAASFTLPAPRDPGSYEARFLLNNEFTLLASVTFTVAPLPAVLGDALGLHFEVATPEQIGVYLPLLRPLSYASQVTVRYRRAVDTPWRIAHPCARIRPDWSDGGTEGFGGSIFDLTPNTLYDVELTLIEPAMPNQTHIAQYQTRALAAAHPAVTVSANVGDNLQLKINALVPGDVLELNNGTYNVSTLDVNIAGTAANPIYIRGQSRAGVIIKNSTIVVRFSCSHVVLENLTLEGSNIDSGTDASSAGIQINATECTIRDLDIRGVDVGIAGYGPSQGITVYNCDLRGNNPWVVDQTNATWNDDGARIPGEGIAVFENTFYAFGDTFSFYDGVFTAGHYTYRNRLLMGGDDSFEGDYSTRNIALYDNYFTNSATFFSLDPVRGGPIYCFRNVMINTWRGPFKFNSWNSSFMIYNNTIIRTDGFYEFGWIQFDNGPLRAWCYRNNVFIYRGAFGTFTHESSANDPIDFTHNAWFPNNNFGWNHSGGGGLSIAEALANLPATTPVFGTSTHRHFGDIPTESDPFVAPFLPTPLGADHNTMVVTTVPPQLRSGTTPKNAGEPIPNITDGFSGAKPDMGAVIEGRAPPQIGAIR